jgi:hypothetical protein
MDVGSLAADVLALVGWREHANGPGRIDLGFLHHHDRIGPGGHRRAGGDGRALPGADGVDRHLAGEHFLDAGQHARRGPRGAGHVGCAHGIAVHRRPRKRRHVVG